MNQPSISVENVWKRYRKGQTGYHTLREDLYNLTGRLLDFGGEKRRDRDAEHIWALRDVSFEVKPGERVGIIGRNGSGKTTLLRLLAGITRPNQGKIIVKGRLGVLIEIMAGFHPELTGRENVYLNGAIMGMSRKEIKRKFDEIVAFAELEEFIDTPIKRYSSGMHVRLGFAVSAHLDPDILLVDEVLAVGDAAFQQKCLGKMGTAAQEGRAVLFVSHNMFAVQNLCTRGILLESGKVIVDGNVNTIIEAYLGSKRKQEGEVCWTSPDKAPGNEEVRLKAVRVVSGNQITDGVNISSEFRIEVDYWNLKSGNNLLISVHLNTSRGICILTSANMPSASIAPDPWYGHPYPQGLFRTSCTIPGGLLNDGIHSISVFINKSLRDNIISIRDVLTFNIKDTGEMRQEYTGEWIGTVRPRLGWHTIQLD